MAFSLTAEQVRFIIIIRATLSRARGTKNTIGTCRIDLHAPIWRVTRAGRRTPNPAARCVLSCRP